MWNFNGPIVQNQAISAKYLKNASVKALNQPWTLWRVKKSVEYYTVLLANTFLEGQNGQRKELCKSANVTFSFQKFCEVKSAQKNFFFTILFSTEISLKEPDWICIKIAHFWFEAWYNILRISPLFLGRGGSVIFWF